MPFTNTDLPTPTKTKGLLDPATPVSQNASDFPGQEFRGEGIPGQHTNLSSVSARFPKQWGTALRAPLLADAIVPFWIIRPKQVVARLTI